MAVSRPLRFGRAQHALATQSPRTQTTTTSPQVACVGGNSYGQLGRGFTSSAELDWAFVAGISDAVHVQCGFYATCVLRAGGKVTCFGYGVSVGAANPHQLTPFDTIPSGAVDLAMGDAHGCAVIEDGSVKCW